jgi:hypothetical protein
MMIGAFWATATDIQYLTILFKLIFHYCWPSRTLSQYETQIDKLVYALYGITDEERAVVEG